MSFFVDSIDVDPRATFKVVEPAENAKIYTGEFLVKLAEDIGLDIQILNDKISPIIVALKNKQKFEYEQKKAKKEQEKRSKANVQKLKEIKFHIGISENDINVKVNKILDFIDKNCKVKLILELRGRENEMDEFAKEKFNSILDKFHDLKMEPVKKMNNSYFTFITK